MKTLVLFDFDGTITSRDSFNDFMIWRFGWVRFAVAALGALPYLARYVFDSSYCLQVKEHFLATFYKGQRYEAFMKDAEAYAADKLGDIIKPDARKRIEEHAELDHELYIVTASPPEWVRPWASKHGIEMVIGSELEVEKSLMTGKIFKHCHAEGKLRCVEKAFATTQIMRKDVHIIAYGDSKGDAAMLEYADVGFYKML